MITYIKAQIDVFSRYKYLLRNLVKRDLTVKYRRSTLGWLWSFLNPLFMMLIMTAVFQLIFKSEIDFFPVYLLAGQLIFNFFSEATNTAMDSVLGNAALIKKVYVPKYVFPLEKVVFSLINAALSLLTLIIVMAVVRVPVTPWVLLFPLPFVSLFFFNIGVGTLLASLVVFFRDIKHIYSILLLALTYLTPIFYPVSMLPGYMQTLIKFNPMYWFVGLFRQLVLYGRAPTLLQWVVPPAMAIVAMVVGLLVMKKTQDKFILHI